MSGTDENDKKGSGAAALLSQLQSQARAARGYEKTLFRVVEVVRGPDGRLTAAGPHLAQRPEPRAPLRSRAGGQLGVAAGRHRRRRRRRHRDAAGRRPGHRRLERLARGGPAGAGALAVARRGTGARPAAGGSGPHAPVGGRGRPPGWATDTLFDQLPDEPAARRGRSPARTPSRPLPIPGRRAARPRAPPAVDIGVRRRHRSLPVPDFIPDPTITGEGGIVLP